jgi:glycosyltransferase involved in cell wall biosynthesis
LRHRLTWNLRELPLAWELRSCDVVVTPLATVFPLLAGMQGRPHVLTLNFSLCTRLDRSAAPVRAVIGASVRSAAGVVNFAMSQRQRLIDQTGIEPARAHVVPYSIDERFWQPAGPISDGYVLAIGRDLARDYATFAAALEGLPARAVVVSAKRNLEGIRLPPNVEARFDLPAAEVRSLYAGARCVVLPTRPETYRFGSEGSGMTSLLEAMAVGRPTVVTERSDLADYVVPGETALTVPPEDPAALRGAVERILGDDELAASLGREGRRLVEERHTTRRFAEHLAEIISALNR